MAENQRGADAVGKMGSYEGVSATTYGNSNALSGWRGLGFLAHGLPGKTGIVGGKLESASVGVCHGIWRVMMRGNSPAVAPRL